MLKLMNAYQSLKATALLYVGFIIKGAFVVCERLPVCVCLCVCFCARVYMFAALSLWLGQCTLQSIIKHV